SSLRDVMWAVRNDDPALSRHHLKSGFAREGISIYLGIAVTVPVWLSGLVVSVWFGLVVRFGCLGLVRLGSGSGLVLYSKQSVSANNK
ncbi:MAG TPA: hypothetical protein VGG97_02895, partial [Bryobacteraceae bacterium]